MHRVTWKPDEITFNSITVLVPQKRRPYKNDVTGETISLTAKTKELISICGCLMGKAPASKRSVEVIIRKFEFIPWTQIPKN
ncbi:hypothetical protein [Peribacillus deserti]|uniref:Uncharacterized protein n=1 Tax=Peribacillus deserti TaxID=673318 RepID=A0A2N5MBS6_9BACI|nr:hypothetical protein [Peribacillus deserti]PLT31806.1 hypothetical protein CUU66_01215 [Peribacillus deserti]